MSTLMKKLNLGCGTDIKKGWINLDSADLPGVDVVHDINILPLPFGENSFDEILCQDILEHTENYIPLLKELHRVLTPGGVLHIRVPHFTSKNNFIDPTHRRMFSSFTFDFFIKGTRWHDVRHYYTDFAFSDMTKPELTFELSSRAFFYNKFVAPIINKSRHRQGFYESTMLSRLFPAVNILITLKK
jgi:ubiquinone/menaquinone biosynthesis C-methylase UbiE